MCDHGIVTISLLTVLAQRTSVWDVQRSSTTLRTGCGITPPPDASSEWHY